MLRNCRCSKTFLDGAPYCLATTTNAKLASVMSEHIDNMTTFRLMLTVDQSYEALSRNLNDILCVEHTHAKLNLHYE
jgi:hypothetical protein